MIKKYEFTNDTREWYGRMLRRIRRLSDGKLGGWIEKESNLSHEGDCWVDNDAYVCDNARVSVFAQVYNNALICDNALMCGRTHAYNNAKVSGMAKLSDWARVYEDALISDDVLISGTAYISASLLYYFKLDGITYYVMEGNLVTYSSWGVDFSRIRSLINLWGNTVPGINLEKFLKETL